MTFVVAVTGQDSPRPVRADVTRPIAKVTSQRPIVTSPTRLVAALEVARPLTFANATARRPILAARLPVPVAGLTSRGLPRRVPTDVATVEAPEVKVLLVNIRLTGLATLTRPVPAVAGLRPLRPEVLGPIVADAGASSETTVATAAPPRRLEVAAARPSRAVAVGLPVALPNTTALPDATCPVAKTTLGHVEVHVT